MSALNKAFIKAYCHHWRLETDAELPMKQAAGIAVDPKDTCAAAEPSADRVALGAYHGQYPTFEQLYVPPTAIHRDPTREVSPGRFAVDSDEHEPLAGISPISRPLSAYGLGLPADTTLLRPRLEVEQFLWPPVCEQLDAQADEALDEFIETFEHQDRENHVLAFAAGARGHGCTTAALSIARRLGARGRPVALVDMHLECPAVAERLGIATERGVVEVLAGEAELEDALIASVEDRLVILPGARPSASEVDATSIGRLIAELSGTYPFVLLDVGCIRTPDSGRAILRSGHVSAVYWVYRDAFAKTASNEARQRCGQGSRIGLIENVSPGRWSLARLVSGLASLKH